MPGQNRMGPMGQGPRTGRGMGLCHSSNSIDFNYGRGFGGGRGFGCRGNRMGNRNRFGSFLEQGKQTALEQQDLQDYISELEAELKEVKEALNNNSDSKSTKDDK